MDNKSQLYKMNKPNKVIIYFDNMLKFSDDFVHEILRLKHSHHFDEADDSEESVQPRDSEQADEFVVALVRVTCLNQLEGNAGQEVHEEPAPQVRLSDFLPVRDQHLLRIEVRTVEVYYYIDNE